MLALYEDGLLHHVGFPSGSGFLETHLQAFEWLCLNWARFDNSIWELRGRARPYLYSRAKCWLALDRAIKLSEAHSFSAPLDRWRRVRDRISKNILSSFWNPRLKSFVQYRGANVLDASLLVLPYLPQNRSTRAVLNILQPFGRARWETVFLGFGFVATQFTGFHISDIIFGNRYTPWRIGQEWPKWNSLLNTYRKLRSRNSAIPASRNFGQT